MAVINQAMRTHVIICLITHMVLSVLSVSANKIDQPISFNHDRSVSTNKNHDRKLLLSLPESEYGGQDTDPVCRKKNPALCYGTGGYPNYFESAQLALTNWARMDHVDYKAKWKNTYSCDTFFRPPVTWETELNQAARFQSYMLGKSDCDFQHDTCSKYCHLFGGKCGTTERIAAYATQRGQENIAAGGTYPNPVRVTDGWLKSVGHCQGFFSDATRLGVGYQKTNTGNYHHYWTQNFGRGSAKYSSLKIPSGSHIHGYPTTEQTTFFVSYYNPGGRAPTKVTAVIGGKEYSLTTKGRVKTAATYSIAINTPSCDAYHFLISADGVSHRHPVSTDYKTYGTPSCAEPLVHPKGSSKPTPTNEVTLTMALDGLCKSSFIGIKGQWKSSYTSSKCKCDCMKQNPCGIVKCVDNDRSRNCRIRTGHANQCICGWAKNLKAKDGTPCGTGKMCLAGKCSARPSSHSVAALVDPDKVSGASTNTNTSTSTSTIANTASPAFTLATLAILLPIIAAVGN